MFLQLYTLYSAFSATLWDKYVGATKEMEILNRTVIYVRSITAIGGLNGVC